jgi:hypothetical protein
MVRREVIAVDTQWRYRPMEVVWQLGLREILDLVAMAVTFVFSSTVHPNGCNWGLILMASQQVIRAAMLSLFRQMVIAWL